MIAFMLEDAPTLILLGIVWGLMIRALAVIF
jgi:hypothetical protein